MDSKEILAKLTSSGLNGHDSSIGGVVIETRPSYRGNFGFHYLKSDKFEALLLKGVYKDMMRMLSGSSNFSSGDWNEIAKCLNESESLIGKPLMMKINLDSGLAYIVSADEVQVPEQLIKDRRDFRIPRPLTPLEYQMPASKLYDESVLLSGGFFGSLTYGVMSPFMESLFVKLPDIMNPIFLSCNLKTKSPSTLSVYNRPYINMTIFEKMLDTVHLGSSIYRANFTPNLYIKRAGAPGHLNKSYFPVERVEIDEIMAELKRTIAFISSSNIVEPAYLDYPVKLCIVAEYIFIKLADKFGKLIKYFPDFNTALQAIYKTRAGSLFYNDAEYELPEVLDFSAGIVKPDFKIDKNIDKISVYLSKLGFFKKLGSKGKIKKIITQVHSLLDLRDELYLTGAEYIKKSREVLLQLADFGIKKSRLTKVSDIFLFEHDEVRRIAFDSFFGDTGQTISFRSWQSERHGAQVVPPEIYGTDFENCAKIADDMIAKHLSLAEIACISIASAPVMGKVTSDLNLNDYSGLIVAGLGLSTPHLGRYKGAAGLIIENASLFGHTAEFAVLNNIPLFMGVRFAPLILNGVDVKIENNKIAKI